MLLCTLITLPGKPLLSEGKSFKLLSDHGNPSDVVGEWGSSRYWTPNITLGKELPCLRIVFDKHHLLTSIEVRGKMSVVVRCDKGIHR